MFFLYVKICGAYSNFCRAWKNRKRLFVEWTKLRIEMNTVIKQKPNCRFCRADKEYQSIKGDFVHGGTEEQKFFKCAQCGIIYLYPPLSPEEEARFYREEFDKYMEKRSAGGMDWSGPEKHPKTNHKKKIP